MVKIEIENKDGIKQYNIPEDWDDLMLGHMLNMLEVQRLNGSTQSGVYPILPESIYETELDYEAALIESLSDISAEELMKLPLPYFKKIKDIIRFCQVDPKKNTKNPNFVMIDGIKYVPIDLVMIETGDIASIEKFNKTPSDGVKNAAILMAMLLRPEVDGQPAELDNLQGIMNRAELFKQKLSFNDYNAIIGNFFDGATLSSSLNTKGSLGNQTNHPQLRILKP